MQFIKTAEDAGIVRAELSGRITPKDVSATFDPFTEEIGPDAYQKRVMLDLSGAEYIDSSGISWLLVVFNRFKEAGGKLVLHSLTPTVLNTIKVLRMHMIFTITESDAQAEAKLLENSSD